MLGPGFSIGPAATVIGGLAALWLVLGPLMARSFRRRTCRGLDAFLASIAVAGGSA